MKPQFFRQRTLTFFFLFLCLFFEATPLATWNAAAQAVKLMNSGASDPLNLGDRLIFIASDDAHHATLWISDGTVSGTAMLRNPMGAWDFSNITPFVADDRGTAYFLRTETQTSSHPATSITELWASNGTAAGTLRVATYDSSIGAMYTPPLVAMGPAVYFAVGQGNQFCLVRSDGTTSGTVTIKSTPHFDYGWMELLGCINGRVLFWFLTASGFELWESDGTPQGTSQLAGMAAGINRNSAAISALGANGSQLFFTIYLDYHLALWRSDGTPEGTAALREVGSFPTGIYPDRMATTACGKWLYFPVYSDSSSPAKLWKTDGTTSGTAEVVIAGHENEFMSFRNQYRPVVFKNKLFFLANGGTNQYLCANDGVTTRGEVIAPLPNPGYGYTQTLPAYGVSAGSDRLLVALPQALWQSDGTSAGSSIICTQQPGNKQLLLLPGQKQWIFAALAPGYASADMLWQTDGTAGGTKPLGWLGPHVGFNASTPPGPLFALCRSNLLYCMHEPYSSSTELWSMPFPPHTGAGRAWMEYR